MDNATQMAEIMSMVGWKYFGISILLLVIAFGLRMLLEWLVDILNTGRLLGEKLGEIFDEFILIMVVVIFAIFFACGIVEFLFQIIGGIAKLVM